MDTTQIKKLDNGKLIVKIDDALAAELTRILEQRRQLYLHLKAQGLTIDDEVFQEIYCHIFRWRFYHFKWPEGQRKDVQYDMPEEEARAKRYTPGVDLTLKLLRPEKEDTAIFSALLGSFWSFSEYADLLSKKNLTPANVVTKITTIAK
jgi:hypothetical protein